MIVRYSPGAKRITVGADKGFDTADKRALQEAALPVLASYISIDHYPRANGNCSQFR
jgi:hypothetical protein